MLRCHLRRWNSLVGASLSIRGSLLEACHGGDAGHSTPQHTVFEDCPRLMKRVNSPSSQQNMRQLHQLTERARDSHHHEGLSKGRYASSRCAPGTVSISTRRRIASSLFVQWWVLNVSRIAHLAGGPFNGGVGGMWPFGLNRSRARQYLSGLNYDGFRAMPYPSIRCRYLSQWIFCLAHKSMLDLAALFRSSPYLLPSLALREMFFFFLFLRSVFESSR